MLMTLLGQYLGYFSAFCVINSEKMKIPHVFKPHCSNNRLIISKDRNRCISSPRTELEKKCLGQDGFIHMVT